MALRRLLSVSSVAMLVSLLARCVAATLAMGEVAFSAEAGTTLDRRHAVVPSASSSPVAHNLAAPSLRREKINERFILATDVDPDDDNLVTSKGGGDVLMATASITRPNSFASIEPTVVRRGIRCSNTTICWTGNHTWYKDLTDLAFADDPDPTTSFANGPSAWYSSAPTTSTAMSSPPASAIPSGLAITVAAPTMTSATLAGTQTGLHGLSGGAIGGITVGGIAGGSLLTFLLFMFCKLRKHRQHKARESPSGILPNPCHLVDTTQYRPMPASAEVYRSHLQNPVPSSKIDSPPSYVASTPSPQEYNVYIPAGYNGPTDPAAQLQLPKTRDKETEMSKTRSATVQESIFSKASSIYSHPTCPPTGANTPPRHTTPFPYKNYGTSEQGVPAAASATPTRNTRSRTPSYTLSPFPPAAKARSRSDASSPISPLSSTPAPAQSHARMPSTQRSNRNSTSLSQYPLPTSPSPPLSSPALYRHSSARPLSLPSTTAHRKSSQLLPTTAGPCLSAEEALGDGYWLAEREQLEADRTMREAERAWKEVLGERMEGERVWEDAKEGEDKEVS